MDVIKFQIIIMHQILFFRHILAVVHFNHNVKREKATVKQDGRQQMKVTYPKFKNGEATVRHVRIKQDFCKFSLQFTRPCCVMCLCDSVYVDSLITDSTYLNVFKYP